MEFEAVIGLEVHCQLGTESKIFCACPARTVDGKSVADIAPNSSTCPICAGHPGTLPVLNRKAVEYAIKAGLATNCRIRQDSVFARKNYFYPDLPKGYQISQYDKPICEEGWLEIETARGSRKVPIQRIHLEEDAGKNMHFSSYSLVNLNRAGVPLIEIVSGPDMKSSEEAGAYLRALHALVTFLGISDANMQEGNFRCDANVSVMPVGSTKFGTRVEVKNVNSFRFVEQAIDYEIARQIELIKSGGKVVQETRGYDSARGVTSSQRSKEEAMDYRYFPDPDLVPVRIPTEFIEKVRGELPELPAQKKQRYIHDLGLPAYDAGLLTASPKQAQRFEQTMSRLSDDSKFAKLAANLQLGEPSRIANEKGVEIDAGLLTGEHQADVVRLLHEQAISSTGAKKIIQIAWDTGEKVDAIVQREGLRQVSDLSALEPVIDQALKDFPAQVAEFKAGKEKVLGFIVGQIMKKTGGKANPALLQELIRKKLQ